MSHELSYNKFLPWKNDLSKTNADQAPDDRSGRVYLHDPKLQLAAETAIVARRPLLILGEPGSGKSSFAAFAARNLKWRYYEICITGRTEARDLLWKFDNLSRLRDAQVKSPGHEIDPVNYVTPGVFWWAFNREDALELISQKKSSKKDSDKNNYDCEPFSEMNHDRDAQRAVVLIDEMDKADPDVPNDLLEVLGRNRFMVDELDRNVERKIIPPSAEPGSPDHYGSLLIIITTNRERTLPAAFIRRCVIHTLEEPEDEKEQIDRLGNIARLHMGAAITSHKNGEDLIRKVAEKCTELRKEAKRNSRRGASIAEYLDALRVCFELGIDTESSQWEQVEKNVLIKEGGNI